MILLPILLVRNDTRDVVYEFKMTLKLGLSFGVGGTMCMVAKPPVAQPQSKGRCV